MKDFNERELVLGDVVIFADSGHKKLRLGIICDFTKQNARILEIPSEAEMKLCSYWKNGYTITRPSNYISKVNDLELIKQAYKYYHGLEPPVKNSYCIPCRMSASECNE